MAVLDFAVESEPRPGAAEKPRRLNFAGVCLWCGVRDCGSPACVALHARSMWMICDVCDGFEAGDCICVHGVVEAARGRD